MPENQYDEYIPLLLVLGGIVLLGFIIRLVVIKLIEKKEAVKIKAESEELRKWKQERRRIEKEREQMEKLKHQKRIETFKNKIKETEKLYDDIKSRALYRLYPAIEKMPYRDHSISFRVKESKIAYDNFDIDCWHFDHHGLPDLKEEQLEDFCIAILKLMEEIILEEDNSLHLSISFETCSWMSLGTLSYKGKPIEGSW